jgi:hypothetical protein
VGAASVDGQVVGQFRAGAGVGHGGQVYLNKNGIFAGSLRATSKRQAG